MGDPHASPRRPRIAVAVEKAEVRRRLQELLEGEEVEVRLLPGPGLLRERLSSLEADVVVVRRSEISGEAGELLGQALADDEAPGIVVLSEREDPHERAELIAAGATGVLDGARGGADLSEDLLALGEAEAEGGLHGPEVGGYRAEPRLADFQSRDPRMREFLELVERVADSETTLLITGETGVGKERLARAIHNESSRSDGPFVMVNCGALPESLLESELFGHEKGAFTGATERRQGRFEQARGGTIFLDEIGEMPPHLQVKLLTVLQRHEVQRLGSEQPVRVDVRVMAATNRMLAEDVEKKRFREDLYYRLNVVSLVIPPLRERPDDVPDLAGTIIRHFRSERRDTGPEGITEGAMKALLAYDWPGNVRELVNVIERAMLLTTGKRIALRDLPEKLTGRAPVPAPAGSGGAGPGTSSAALHLDRPLREARRRVVAAFERAYLAALLERFEGVVGKTAKAAGINPRTLYDKMKQYGLRKEDFRT